LSFTPEIVVLLGGLAVASVTDLSYGRIPNALTFPMMILGMLIHATTGPTEWWFGVAGCGLAFAVHFALFALGIEKAGDAKLMMGLGACVGWAEMIEATAWLAILYLPIGLAILAARGQLSNLVAVFRWQVAKARGEDPGEKPEANWFVTGPVIAVAGVLGWLTDWLAWVA
jgi:Flp pilus assembly protein protease CpaA